MLRKVLRRWEWADQAQVARNSFRKAHGCILPRAVSRKTHMLTVTTPVPPAVLEESPTGSGLAWVCTPMAGEFRFQLSNREGLTSCPLSISYQAFLFLPSDNPLPHCYRSADWAWGQTPLTQCPHPVPTDQSVACNSFSSRQHSRKSGQLL